MICTGGKQTAKLEVAPFTGNALGPAKVLLDGRLFAAPAWSPDGKALAYFAPAGAAGHFQLWYLALPAVPPSASASASTSATPSVGTTPTVRASASPAPTSRSPFKSHRASISARLQRRPGFRRRRVAGFLIESRRA